MSYAIVFSSKTGNTELLADTLHSCLPQADCCYFGNPNPAAMEADTLYVGFWTDKGKADESASVFLKQLRGKQVFLFGTAGFGGSEEYFNKILKTVQKDLHSSNTVIGSFMCQGKMPMSVRQRYENMKKQPLHLPNLDAAFLFNRLCYHQKSGKFLLRSIFWLWHTICLCQLRVDLRG